MLKKNNFGAKNKVFMNYIKIVGIFLFVVVFAFAFKVMSVLADYSPSVGGHYNGYNEPDDDFDWGFDDDCDCDDDDDDDDNNDDEPDATTKSASSVRATSATLNARIDGNGSSTRAWFEYGRDRDLDDETSSESVGSGTNNVDIRISGLKKDTTYYFRVVARNSEGTDYGSILSFRTDGNNNNNDDEDNNDLSVPSARTNAATFITENSAQLNSLIIDPGSNETNTWFEWGTNVNLGNKTEKILVDASPSFTHKSTIVGLTPGVTYYFRAVAENEEWRKNGSILSFTTLGGSFTPTRGGTTPPKNPPTPSTGGETKGETPSTTTEGETPAEEVGGLGSILEANVLGFGFFPTTLLGWMAFVIFILTLYILGRKYLFPSTHQTVAVETHRHH